MTPDNFPLGLEAVGIQRLVSRILVMVFISVSSIIHLPAAEQEGD